MLLSTYALFKFISFKQNNWLPNSHSNNNQSDDTPIQNKVIFGVESQFSQYAVEHTSVNQQMLGDIAHDLQLDIEGWSQFGIFDLVHPTQVKFIFADIEVDPIV